MGWARGSDLFERIVGIVDPPDDEEGEELCQQLVAAFEDFDCDTLEECEGINPALDRVLASRYPPED